MTSSTPWYPPPGLTDRHYDPAAGTGMFLCNPPFMTEPTPLSPAAQAVLDAANRAILDGPDCPDNDARWIASAVLLAAADQVVPEPDDQDKERFSTAALRLRWVMRDQLFSIAAELEGAG